MPFRRLCSIPLLLCVATATPAATYTVTTLADAAQRGHLTLREAIAAANAQTGASLIVFDPALVAGADATLTLRDTIATPDAGTSAFVIDREIRIVGPRGKHGITLDVASDVQARHFLVRRTGHLALAYLALTHGRAVGAANAGSGGAIAVLGGRADLDAVYLAGNAADPSVAYDTGGGALYGAPDGSALPTITLTNATLYDNAAYNGGGGIYMTAGTLDVAFSTLARNRTGDLNGYAALYASGATVRLYANVIWNRKDATGANAYGAEVGATIAEGRYNFIAEPMGCARWVPPQRPDGVPPYCASHDYTILAGVSALVAATPVRQGGPTPVLPAAAVNGYVLQLDVVPRTEPRCQALREDGRGYPRPRTSRNVLLEATYPTFVPGGCDAGAFETQGVGDRWSDAIFYTPFE